MANFNFADLRMNQLSFDTKGIGSISIINQGLESAEESEIFIIYDPNRFLPFMQHIIIKMMASNLWTVSLFCAELDSVPECIFLQHLAEQLIFDMEHLPTDWHYMAAKVPADLRIQEGDIGAITQWVRGHYPEVSSWMQGILDGKDKQIFDDCSIVKEGGAKNIITVNPAQHGLKVGFGLVEFTHPIYGIAWGDESISPTPADEDPDYV